jgi:hypothetical protein
MRLEHLFSFSYYILPTLKGNMALQNFAADVPKLTGPDTVKWEAPLTHSQAEMARLNDI